jgi:hypothetical protein
MPKYPLPPGESRVVGELAAINRDIAALKKQTTQYVVNPEGVCTAIIGNLATEPSGASTGLEGWGIALLAAGHWRAVSAFDSGQASVRWPGSNTLSEELTVPHGLGAAPRVVLATMNATGEGQIIICHASANASDLFVQAAWSGGFQPSTGSLVPVSWRVEL